jgi:hypothetical protein
MVKSRRFPQRHSQLGTFKSNYVFMMSQVMTRARLCVSMHDSCSAATWGDLTDVLSELIVRIVQPSLQYRSVFEP